MPNNCWTKLHVQAPDEESIDAFVEAVHGGSDEFGEFHIDFERIRPTPDELSGENAPAADPLGDGGDWFSWRVIHWGTKWSAMYSRFRRNRRKHTATYIFATAWSPAEPLLEYAAALWPDLEFTMEYLEEFEHYAGRARAKAGRMVEIEDLDPSDLRGKIR